MVNEFGKSSGLIKPGDSNFNMVPAQEVSRFHENDDVDHSKSSHHHTLGMSPTQAAAGDHKHDDRYVKSSLVINGTDFRINGFTGNLELLKQGRVVTCAFELNTPGGGVSGGTAMARMTTGWMHFNIYVNLKAMVGYDNATGNPIPYYFNNGGFLMVAILRGAGTTTSGNFTYMSDS